MLHATLPTYGISVSNYLPLCFLSEKTQLEQYMNIIRLLHCEWILSSPLKDNFLVAQTLKGIRRYLGDDVERENPVTSRLLCQMLQRLNLSNFLDSTTCATCVTIFYVL